MVKPAASLLNVKNVVSIEAVVMARSVQGDTALGKAAIRGHVDVCQRLLDAGADRESRDLCGETCAARRVPNPDRQNEAAPSLPRHVCAPPRTLAHVAAHACVRRRARLRTLPRKLPERARTPRAHGRLQLVPRSS